MLAWGNGRSRLCGRPRQMDLEVRAIGATPIGRTAMLPLARSHRPGCAGEATLNRTICVHLTQPTGAPAHAIHRGRACCHSSWYDEVHASREGPAPLLQVVAAAVVGCSLWFTPQMAQAAQAPQAPQTPCQATVSASSSQQDDSRKPNLLADLAGLFGEERDPIGAFTLYGTTVKKYLIEKLDGEKIIARQKGFTVDTCVASARENEETPSFRFLPVGEKVRASDNTVCRHVEGQDLEQACLLSCQLACTGGLDAWEARNQRQTGFVLLAKDRDRLKASCTRECAMDCTRPGKAYDFAIPYRK